LLFFALVASAAVNPLRNLSERSIKYNTWVVLVAGSTGWGNKRHQADLCHAYHAIHDFGIPEDHIIVMMPDDVAFCSENGKPGVLYHGYTDSGTNVYNGVPHDYTHDLVRADVLRDVLLDNEVTVGSKKTLKSGPNDNVFFYYSDHGGSGYLPFPAGDGEITGEAFVTLINEMNQKQKFKNLVIYIEACFSGSLFYNHENDLPENVFIATAAPVGAPSYSESLWRDTFSYAWIHDLETADSGHTFGDQFDAIDDYVQNSQSCSYGSESLRDMTLDEFFGPSFAATRSVRSKNTSRSTDMISNIDFEFVVAQREYAKNPSPENKKELDKQLAIRKAVDALGASIVSVVNAKASTVYPTRCSEGMCNKACECFNTCTDPEIGNYDADFCHYACCQQGVCHADYGTKRERDEFSRVQTCVNTLSYKLYESCGRPHTYLLSIDERFRILCKAGDFDMTKALEAIETKCATFSLDDL